MRIRKRITISYIVIFLILFDLFNGLNINFFVLRPVISFLFLTFLPGFLLLLNFNIRKISFWDLVLYSAGLSIFLLYFYGLFINSAYLHIGLNRPLSTGNLLPGLNLLIALLTIGAFGNTRNVIVDLQIQKNLQTKIFLILPLLFPLLSIFATNVLNNNGPNILVIINILAISCYAMLLIILRKNMDSFIYPWSVFLISLAVLFIYTLRSWHIIGYDINLEYRTFLITKTTGTWDFSKLKDAYNACLSLTILPAIYSSFLHFNDEYIFKLIYPVIFALTPVAVYQNLQKNFNKELAFIASFFFIAQIEFMSEMPGLVRQQIAFFFFALMLLIHFSRPFGKQINKIFFILFGLSLVVSHYSTTYIADIVLLCSFVFYLIIRLYNRIKNRAEETHYSFNFYLLPVIILFSFTFIWYVQITNTALELPTVFSNSVKNFTNLFSKEQRSEASLIAIFNISEGYNQKDINQFVKSVTPQDMQPYPLTPEYSDKIPYKGNISILADSLYRNIITLTKIFLLLGVVYLFYLNYKKNAINTSFILLSLTFEVLVALFILLPYLSTQYNYDRLLQQALMILAVLPMIMYFSIVKRLSGSSQLSYVIITATYVFQFIMATGLMYQFYGGITSLQINNFGENFNFYTQDTEVNSLQWLSDHYDNASPIYIDRYASLKLQAYTRLPQYRINKTIVPGAISKNSYVYSSYINTTKDKTFAYFNFKVIGYNYPQLFLDRSKNLIYNNGETKIYK